MLNALQPFQKGIRIESLNVGDSPRVFVEAVVVTVIMWEMWY